MRIITATEIYASLIMLEKCNGADWQQVGDSKHWKNQSFGLPDVVYLEGNIFEKATNV
jgi:hypothetical protein